MATCSELSDMDLAEDYKSPFDFNSGVDRNYLYLSPGINLSPPGSPTLTKPGNVLLSLSQRGVGSLVASICRKDLLV